MNPLQKYSRRGTRWIVVWMMVAAWTGADSVPVFAQGGRKLPGIYIMNADGSDFRLLVKLAGKWNGTPSLSADGKTLLFDASAGGRYHLGHVFVMPIQGTDQDVLDLGAGNTPSFSPDGKQILFYVHAGNPEGVEPGVWVMNSDGLKRRWLSTGRCPRWSPDGKSVLIVDDLQQTGDGLYIMNLEKPEDLEVILVQTHPAISGAAWSADGKRLAYIRDTEKGSELVIESLAANNRHERIRLFRPFTDGQSARGGHGLGGRPVWSADGKYLLCWLANAEGQKQVYRIEIDTDREPELLPHQDGRFNADPTWSRDGKRIVFLSDQ